MFLLRIALISAVTLSVTACAQVQSAPAESMSTSAMQTAPPAPDGSTQPHPAMLRYPDVGPSHIVFVYADDLWVVPREGGTASPLASPAGQERFPKFSANGATIAFVGNYEGNADLYTIPLVGGIPKRVTHHPAGETLCDWTADGSLLFYSNSFAPLGRQTQLMTVPSTGGLPSVLPPPYGANGAISADGKWLAYTPHTRDTRTWKRHRGGMATDIWLFDLENNSATKITDWEGTDTLPMWQGDRIYYLSDAGPNHRLNIWSYDTLARRHSQVTRYADYDVKWPSIGPGSNGEGEIVFQNGAGLYLLNLQTSESRAVPVSIPGDRPSLRVHNVDAGKNLAGGDISSTGKRAVVEARGDIWTIPAKNGAPRNLTRTAGVAERDPAWSPDGQWIAYFSDATGDYELYITQSDGKGETKKLTDVGALFRFNPTWSPDSKHIAFCDNGGRLHLHSIDAGVTKHFDTKPAAGRARFSWSHDSAWIAYTKSCDNQLSAVWLYHVESDEKHQVTSGTFNTTQPTFDRKGDYLLLASNSDFSEPSYEDIGSTFIYADTDTLAVVPLRDEVGSPWAPKSDEEAWKDEKDADADEGEGDKKDGDDKGDDVKPKPDGDDGKGDEDAKPADGKKSDEGDESASDEKTDKEDAEEDKEPLVIELEGFERRAVPIPVKRGNFGSLSFTHDGKLIYVRRPRRGSGDDPAIKLFDLEDDKKKEKSVVDGTGGYSISADGKKLLVRKEESFYIVDADADQKLEKSLSLSGLTTKIDPRTEWRQIFTEAWRIQRDFFYDPNMHGVDWDAVRVQYSAMLDDCVSRRDVTFVIGEMLSELNVGHAYVRGVRGLDAGPSVSVGMLGVDYELHEGAYRIAKILEGAPWDIDARGPLSQPGVDVKEGDYLLAVDGVPIDMGKDPWAAFQGLADKVVTLKVSEKPTDDDDARDVVVKPLSREGNLRYRAWIEQNRAYVAEKTNGRVGYLFVPDTGVNGQNNLIRQFFGQRDRSALIIDERWNGGGQLPSRFVELLNRPVTNHWALRHARDWTSPQDAHHGPKCMLINGLSASGGDCFPYYFRHARVGKLIGTRTWGGLVGYTGTPRFIDGGSTTVPAFAFYELDGTWGIEGHGVDPDIEVIDDPSLMVDGGDPQLDAAIDHMLAEIKRYPFKPARRPAYPDRSGMGIAEEDK